MLSELQENYTKKSVGDLILNGLKVFFLQNIWFYLAIFVNLLKYIAL